MPRKLPILAAVCVALAWITPPALATDYCVAPNTSCGSTNVPTFEAALDAANDANDADRVFLGATTYTAAALDGFSYNAPGAVEIAGAGAGQTILTGQVGGSSQVLRLVSGPGSSVHDLTARLPQNAGNGLAGVHTNASVQRIVVAEALTQSNFRTGVRLFSGGSLTDSDVMLAKSHGSIGVHFLSAGALRDSTVEASTALFSDGGVSVERAMLRGGTTGVLARMLTTSITDSLISVTEPASAVIEVNTEPGHSTSVVTDGVTLVGSGTTPSWGVRVSNSNADLFVASANLTDTIIRGAEHPLQTSGAGSGAANINVAFSDYDPAGNVDDGPGAITATDVSNVGDARFVDAAGGDYRLRFDSPLIDVGDPDTPSTLTDLAGGARLVDGDAVEGARRDIGAYEYQAQQPTASIAGPVVVQAGAQVSFSGAGSSDPDGETLVSYAWTIDGLPAGNGPTLDAVFANPGDHVVVLTVTDLGGRQGSATQAVTVTGLPLDTIAPIISGLQVRPSPVRRGRRFSVRFRLDEAASARLRIERAVPGRREGGACRKPTDRNRSARRCTRYVRVTGLTRASSVGANLARFSGKVRRRALAKGRYRAVVTATDAVGNRSAARRVSFRIVAIRP